MNKSDNELVEPFTFNINSPLSEKANVQTAANKEKLLE